MTDYKEYLVRVYSNHTIYGRMVNDKFQVHREDGPAEEFADGRKYWYLNDKLHREDGPACEHADGTKDWYLNGACYSEANFKLEMQKKQAPTCEGKTVEIDGKKYKLTLIDQ